MTSDRGVTHATASVAPGATVSYAINAERLTLLAWTRAILLQLAHPLVAAGVAEHSSFRGSPLKAVARLHHTVRAMLALTFGDERARAAAIDAIMAIHRRVRGVLPVGVGPFPAGTPYSAEDPALVLWVHATLLDSLPLVYGHAVRPLSGAEHDRYCEEAGWVAVALGARDADVPRTWNALQTYLNSSYASGAIVVGPQARELSAAILRPPLSTVVAPATWANRLVTVGLLPEGIRRQYGFSWDEQQQRTMMRVLGAVALLRSFTPRALAWWPEARRPTLH
jgi:uncharacterized protein (DUF2236 family)